MALKVGGTRCRKQGARKGSKVYPGSVPCTKSLLYSQSLWSTPWRPMMGAQEGSGHRRPEASILFLRNHALTSTHTTHSCVASAAGNFAKSNQRMREDTASILTSALRPPHEAELSFKIESVFFRRFSLHSVFFVQKSLFIPQSSSSEPETLCFPASICRPGPLIRAGPAPPRVKPQYAPPDCRVGGREPQVLLRRHSSHLGWGDGPTRACAVAASPRPRS